MKPRNILLAVALLTGVAADTPPSTSSDDKLERVVRRAIYDYRLNGSSVTVFIKSTQPDTACVRCTTRKDGQDFTAAIITLRRTPNGTWQVESCAR